ncbi:ubiquinol-cytochrome-c reductase complex assembly factor 3 [Hypomesus transpacificus]|uniref:ubiquinol-cytochrome-c reductase complex assembly factor 3 n=1 Tax=Hypomesus transpacificus TaxID=137520 RepID=UPI001F07D6CF|nr:ubiquinol-cytochrome-c reductase complex assembly factor 3 [Hypomesus transpacificus]
MSNLRVIFTYTALLGLVGMGYAMWAAVAPGEDRRNQLIKNLPESNPVRMEESRRRTALIMQVLKEAAETPDNIARGTGGAQK